ncbi:unnamed protein product, partial [Rotaria sp. Silwood1]
HLNVHVEITKQNNKRRLDSLRNELNTVVNTLKLIVKEKLLTIEREQNLIEQAKEFLMYPVVQLMNYKIFSKKLIKQ